MEDEEDGEVTFGEEGEEEDTSFWSTGELMTRRDLEEREGYRTEVTYLIVLNYSNN